MYETSWLISSEDHHVEGDMHAGMCVLVYGTSTWVEGGGL